MRVITHRDGLTDLAADLARIPGKLNREAPKVLRRSATQGNKVAQGFAKERSGPHGKRFYKRMNAELTSPRTAEFGPDGTPKTEFVGAGYRNGVNLDLLDAADIIGPVFADAVGEMAEDLFW